MSRRAAISLGVAIAVVLVVAAVALLVRDDAAVETTATTTSSSTAGTRPTTTLGPFDAPPAQPRATTTSAAQAPSTTTTTTSTTTTPTTAPPSTAPPPRARPGPAVETQAGRHEAVATALADARRRWAAVDGGDGYVFRTRRRCFCPAADNEIRVGPDGRVVGQRTMRGDPEQQPPSVDELFDQIASAIEADVDEIRVSFDRERGFPVELDVDPDQRVADDEFGRTISWLLLPSDG